MGESFTVTEHELRVASELGVRSKTYTYKRLADGSLPREGTALSVRRVEFVPPRGLGGVLLLNSQGFLEGLELSAPGFSLLFRRVSATP